MQPEKEIQSVQVNKNEMIIIPRESWMARSMISYIASSMSFADRNVQFQIA